MSRSWQLVLGAITDEYCSRNGNQDKSIKSLVAKHMNEIAGSMSIPRDQAEYLLSGGVMKRNSFGTPMKCSVQSVDIESFGNQSDKSFQWKNIEKRYSNRSDSLEHLNLYLFCVNFWKEGKITIPQFFGYHDVPTWPLNESYSKWTLAIFKPWRESIDEHQDEDGTFSTTLKKFMYNLAFPARKRAEILRVKLKVAGVDTEEGVEFQEIVEEIDNNVEEDAMFVDAIESAISQNSSIGSTENVGLSEAYFNLIPEIYPDNYDWSKEYNSVYENWLTTFAKEYYETNNINILNNSLDSVEIQLHEKDTYKPENCIGESQKFIIYHNLYYQYLYAQYCNGETNIVPNQQFVFVEGKPGTGKTFVVKTLRNMNRIIHNSNTSDLASAPTGCASALIDGSTHFRLCKIPTGVKFYKAPSNLKMSSILELKSLKKIMTSNICRIMDEHSQTGRPFWAWLKNRHEYLRRPQIIRNKENDIILDENLNFPLEAEISKRPWGGIPLIYSFGDCFQLPPVKMKAIYDNSAGKPDSSDNFGRIAFSEFIDSDHLDTTDSVIVKMDNVLRQDNLSFLKTLENLRNGTVDDDDVQFFLS